MYDIIKEQKNFDGLCKTTLHKASPVTLRMLSRATRDGERTPRCAQSLSIRYQLYVFSMINERANDAKSRYSLVRNAIDNINQK